MSEGIAHKKTSKGLGFKAWSMGRKSRSAELVLYQNSGQPNPTLG